METIKSFLEIIQTFQSVIITLGVRNIVLLVIIFYVIFLVNKYLKEKRERYYYDTMIREKNQNLEQLADDNRLYRDIYLKEIQKINPEIYKEISAEKVKMKED